MKWIKASEDKIPPTGKVLFRFLDTGQKHLINLISETDFKVELDFRGYHYKKDQVEWLDESASNGEGKLTKEEIYFDLKEKNARTGASADTIALAAMEEYLKQFKSPSPEPPTSLGVSAEGMSKGQGHYEEWETGENGKPQPPHWLQEKALNIVNEQMEKRIAAGSLNNRFSIRGFGVDLLCHGYKIKNDSLKPLSSPTNTEDKQNSILRQFFNNASQLYENDTITVSRARIAMSQYASPLVTQREETIRELRENNDVMGKILMERDGEIESLKNDLWKYKALAELGENKMAEIFRAYHSQKQFGAETPLTSIMEIISEYETLKQQI